MTTRLSAFGVVHTVAKSEYAPGKHRPITELGAGTVRHLRSQFTYGDRQRSEPFTINRGRDLATAYDQHSYVGYGRDIGKEMAEHTTRSAVHPKVHYGDSVSPEHRAGLDAMIEPKIARKLRRPVVIHHAPDLASAGAAIPPHVTTGGKGHVALHSVDPKDFTSPHGLKMEHVVNHELVHTNVRSRSPYVLPARMKRMGGEEGRADAISGMNAYQKLGSIPRPVAADYHKVRSIIEAAQKARTFK